MNSANRHDVFRDLLYGTGPVTRFTQDSPVLPDVWMAFAVAPGEQQDLILTPYQPPVTARQDADAGGTHATGSPGRLAQYLKQRLERADARAPSFRRSAGRGPGVARNQTSVAVRLYFDELVRVVLPLSGWWSSRVRGELRTAASPRRPDGDRITVSQLSDAVVRETIARRLSRPQSDDDGSESAQASPDVLWALRIIGSIAWMHGAGRDATLDDLRRQLVDVWHDADDSSDPSRASTGEQKRLDSDRLAFCRYLVRSVADLYADWSDPISEPSAPSTLVHLVSLNRPAKLTVWRSRTAVKADAVKRLFEASASRLTWAVVDDGIDARHPAFRRRDAAGLPKPGPPGWEGESRVRATYNFARIRNLLSGDSEDIARLPGSVRRRIEAAPEFLEELRASLTSGREIDWTALLPLIEIPHDASYQTPNGEHGTHVAGILAADWHNGDGTGPAEGEALLGVCPDLNLLDLRVIDKHGGDEFSVMAALQFVRHLNAQSHVMRVHGVNLSLAIHHDVVNYACGRTPVCLECERLVGDGIVVVAAAGNDGYVAPRGQEAAAGYRTVSVVDPGNAEGVITVGSTHRSEPHSYGVSYFSSRGPTGDGRLKPDLVAPGEKIESCVPGGGPKRMDGTSMAAPHVSGAAALLMARNAELIGQPRRIKEILCRTATDLGRERYFQGCGMLDVLRALQSV
ncbi:MAG: S8 family peptidase [Planctomycetaceae bacterium]